MCSSTYRFPHSPPPFIVKFIHFNHIFQSQMTSSSFFNAFEGVAFKCIILIYNAIIYSNLFRRQFRQAEDDIGSTHRRIFVNESIPRKQHSLNMFSISIYEFSEWGLTQVSTALQFYHNQKILPGEMSKTWAGVLRGPGGRRQQHNIVVRWRWMSD